MTLTTVLSICAREDQLVENQLSSRSRGSEQILRRGILRDVLGNLYSRRRALSFPLFLLLFHHPALFHPSYRLIYWKRESFFLFPTQLTPTTRFQSTLRDVDGGCQFLYSLLLPSCHACIVNHRCLVRDVVGCESHSVPASK